MQVRVMSTPPSLSGTQGQYVDAMALFANAAAEMLNSPRMATRSVSATPTEWM